MNCEELKAYKQSLTTLIQTRTRPNIILALQMAKGVGLLDWAKGVVWELRIFEKQRGQTAFAFWFVVLFLTGKSIEFQIYDPCLNNFTPLKHGDCLLLGCVRKRKEMNKSINYAKDLVFSFLETYLE